MIKLTNWLKNIWRTIRSLFNKIPAELRSAIHIGVLITENIKLFVESPVADVLTILIPGEIDDRIKTVLRSAIPKILLQLKLADKCLESSSTNEITLCAIKNLGSLTDDTKNIYLHNLSILISQAAADGKLTWEDGAYIAEWYYQKQFKNSKIL